MYLKKEGVKHGDCLVASVSSGTEMARCFMAIISRSGVQAAEGGKNNRKKRAGWGRQMGIPGSKGSHSNRAAAM